MNKEDEIYVSRAVDNRDCILFIIQHYYNIMKEELKMALQPWKESLKSIPIEIRITLGEVDIE